MAKRTAATRQTKPRATNRPAWLDEGAALIAQRKQELTDDVRELCVEMGGQVAAHEKDADRLRQLEREWVEYSEAKYGNGVMLTGDLASEYRADEAAYRAAKAQLSESLGIGDNPPPVKHVERRPVGTFVFPPADFEQAGLRAEDIVWGVGVALPIAATKHAQAGDESATPVYLGDGKIEVGGKVISMHDSQSAVLESLIILRSCTKQQLQDQSGNNDAVRVLGRLRKQFPALAPYIELPGGKGRGGYSTRIKPKDGWRA